MMTNLFSVFDPSTTILNWSLNWFSSILGLIIMPTLFWFLPNRLYFIWTNILMKLNQEFKTLLGIKNYKISMIFTSLFLFIMFNNLLGLFPYIFTSSSHMNFTLTLALPLWISFMIYGWINNTNHMFTHLVPQGTPNVLMPFMVCIETISNIIRPGTLAIRLAANMIAGHLLLTLLGNTSSSLMSIMISLLLLTQILLLMLENCCLNYSSLCIFSFINSLF
uniref:ATP synthase subunit a n=1 Tax=Inocellia fujiana TaxID=1821759 RepID=A0A1S5QYK9_9NEOP|nr:ATP synthase F0 subunit 6 [Inocellia fujiana]